MSAIFITFEGMEGVGKSTQIQSVYRHFQNQGFNVLLTREPGGTELGNRVRDILLNQASEHLHPQTELLLLEAARAQHVQQVLVPGLTHFDAIFCDRYTDSTVAYQSGARGIDLEWIHTLNLWATSGLLPELTILLDMSPEDALQRALARIADMGDGNKEDRFENEKLDFHRSVREAYLNQAKKDPARYFIVDASGAEGDITKTIIAKIAPMFGRPI